MFQFKRIEEVKALMPITLNRIITHVNPSIDEIVAECDILYHSEGKFIQPADGIQVDFLGPVELAKLLAPYNGDLIHFLIETGTLVIGTAGSFLDEHEHELNDHCRAEGECAATLTSKLLGTDSDPLWNSITKYALQDDLGKRQDHNYLDASMTLPNLIKAAYSVNKEDVEWVVNESTAIIEGYYQALRSGRIKLSDKPDWHLDTLAKVLCNSEVNEAVKKFREIHKRYQAMQDEATRRIAAKLKVCRELDYKGRRLGIALAETDADNITTGIFKTRPDVHILVVEKRSGNVQIFTRRNWNIDLSNTVGILRKMENIKQRRRPPHNDDLYLPGKLPECGEWFYFNPPSKTDMIFNGSLTAPDVAPTKLLNENIRKAIVEGIALAPIRFRQQVAHKPLDLSNGSAMEPASSTAIPQYVPTPEQMPQPASINI